MVHRHIIMIYKMQKVNRCIMSGSTAFLQGLLMQLHCQHMSVGTQNNI